MVGVTDADVAGGFLVELPPLGLLFLDETGVSTRSRSMTDTTAMWQVPDYSPSNTAFKIKHFGRKSA